MSVGRRCALVTLLLLAVAVSACGGGSSPKTPSGATIDWDLSQSHTRGDVDWPSRDLDATEVAVNGKPVRIRLPHGIELRLPEGVADRINLLRTGETLESVDVHTVALDKEAAFELARSQARRFSLPLEPLQKWNDQPDATSDVPTAFTGSRGKPLGGPGGARLDIEINASFKEDAPYTLNFSIGFPGDGSGAKPPAT